MRTLSCSAGNSLPGSTAQVAADITAAVTVLVLLLLTLSLLLLFNLLLDDDDDTALTGAGNIADTADTGSGRLRDIMDEDEEDSFLDEDEDSISSQL